MPAVDRPSYGRSMATLTRRFGQLAVAVSLAAGAVAVGSGSADAELSGARTSGVQGDVGR